jgi:glycosyl transferase family 87
LREHPVVRPLVRHRGRALAAALVGGYFLLIAGLGGYTKWGRLGVPPVGSKNNLWFGDLRNVTTAWECTRRGIAVLPLNPCDPWQRPTNYPRLWLFPSFLGLGEGSTFVLGLILAAVFLLAALALLPRDAGYGAGAVYGAALCSPAVMLGVQRGNVDLAVFAVIVAAVLVSSRQRVGTLLADALVLLAAVLKLFPILAAGFLVRRSRRAAWVGAAVVLGAFAIDVVATRDNIRALAHAVPQVDDTSYGLRRFSEWASAALTDQPSLRVWDIAIVIAVLVAVGALRRPLRAHLGAAVEDAVSARDLDLFWAGALIYIGSYALFRSFDYRLVFVLPALPQLLRWAGARRWLGIVTLLALFGTLWLDAPWAGVPVIGAALDAWKHVSTLPPAVAAQLVLFIGFAGGLVATAPAFLPSWRSQTVRPTTPGHREVS